MGVDDLKVSRSGMNNIEKISEEGAVFLIDKDLQWTSFDVVKKIRNTLKIKKVGHAGTLDPLATGLLIVCAGRKTKQINQFQNLKKEYTGVFEVGKTTPSFDLETGFDSKKDCSHLDDTIIANAAKKFLGDICQTPPLFSAVKINGKRAYEFARKGEEAEIKTRNVHVELFEISKINLPELRFRLVCSKGFYVRSLARDFGRELGVGAYLKELRREKIGDFSVENALKIDEFAKI